MRIIFMGSPDFALPALQTLLGSEHEIVCVYSQPPRPKGRGQKLQPTPVHMLAEAHGLEVRTPEKLKGDALDAFLATSCDLVVVVAYGLLLPKKVVDHVPCLNIHPSTLPRWRGAAPLQHTLLNGDPETDVCVMRVDVGMDTGNVLVRQTIPVDENITLGELHDETAQLGAQLLLDALAAADFTGTPQIQSPADEARVKLAPKIEKEDRPLDWTKPARTLHNQIRAYSPFPSATAHVGEEPWKVLRSQMVEGQGTPGEILALDANGITVACGEGALLLTELQRPGKSAQPAGQIVQAHLLKPGEHLR